MGLLTIRYFLTKTIIFKQVKWQLLNKALIKLLYFDLFGDYITNWGEK